MPFEFNQRARRLLFGAVASRALVALWIGYDDPRQSLLFSIGSAAFVPGLLGRFDPFAMVLSVAPELLLCFGLSDYLHRCLQSDGVIVVPRNGSRASWALLCCARMALLVLTFETASAIALLLVQLVRSDAWAVPDSKLLLGILICLALDGLVSFLLALCVNALGAVLDSLAACAAVFGMHVATCLVTSSLPPEVGRAVVPWLLSTRGVPAWHEEVVELYGYGTGSAPMSSAISVLVLLVAVACELVWIVRWSRGLDLL